MEYLDDLAAAAESTLSPEIYEEVWGFPQPSGWKRVYLAVVSPRRTLDLLLSARRGVRFETSVNPDIVCRRDTGACLGIQEALDLLLEIAETESGKRDRPPRGVRRILRRACPSVLSGRRIPSIAPSEEIRRYSGLRLEKHCIGRHCRDP